MRQRSSVPFVIIAILCTFASVVAGQQAAEPVQRDFVPNELIVKFRPGTIMSVRTTLFQRAGAVKTRQLRYIPQIHVLDFPEGTNLDLIIAAFKNDPNVKFIARNAVAHIASVFPNDLNSNQWNLHNTGQTGGTSDVDIDAPEAWGYSDGSCYGNSVVVAVIDTGVDTDHWDLEDNFLTGKNVINEQDENDVEETSSHSHGTTIAGIIAAVGNNGLVGGDGSVGIAYRAKVLPVKFCDLTNYPFYEGCADADLAEAIVWARSQGAKIFNVSSQFTGDIPASLDEIEAGEALGELFVFAAGNADFPDEDGIDIDTAGSGNIYPCVHSNPNVICVAAVDDDGNKAQWSNYGGERADIGAPGVHIYSTLNNGEHGESGPLIHDYPDGSGTSFAAPHVSGVLALVKAANTTYDYRELRESVLVSAQPTPTGDLEGQVLTEGMVNARAAVTSYADSFDDATNLSSFFSNSQTGDRWAVAQNGGARCDVQVKTMSGTGDRTAEAKFSKRAGDAGSYWTLASYADSYPPSNGDQALVLRVATTDGSDFEDDKGRIGVGFVEEEYVGLAPCSQTSQYYSETTFRESSMGGIELDGEGNAVPFVYFHIPNPVPEEVFWAEYYYDEDSFSVDGVSKLSIQIYYGAQSMYLYVSNSVTGEELYSRQGISYPTPEWPDNLSFKPAFIYYGVDPQESAEHKINVRNFLSIK